MHGVSLPLVFFPGFFSWSPSTQATRYQVLPPLAQMPSKLAFHGVRLPVVLVIVSKCLGNCCGRHGRQRISVPRVSQSNTQFSKGLFFDVLVFTVELFTGQLTALDFRDKVVSNELLMKMACRRCRQASGGFSFGSWFWTTCCPKGLAQ